MRQILKVQISDNKEYPIEISDNSFAKLNQELYEATRGQKRLVVMSKKVYNLYFKELNFSEEEVFVLKDGEILYIDRGNAIIEEVNPSWKPE